MIKRQLWLAFALAWPSVALAHSPFSSDGAQQVAAGLTLLIIAALWLLYFVGDRRSPAARWRRWLFHATTLLTLATVLGPLDDWAENSSAAHMTQHMLMMVVIAPLFTISRPLPQFFAATKSLRRLWLAPFRLTGKPMACAWLHGFVIWFWHLPPFYLLALENPWWHVVEHACFLVTAMGFWWAVLHSDTGRAPQALLALLFTLMHTGFLGAFLTFASAPWYPGESRDLADQQLAGLLMWVMGGIPYMIGALWAARRWYRRLAPAVW